MDLVDVAVQQSHQPNFKEPPQKTVVEWGIYTYLGPKLGGGKHFFGGMGLDLIGGLEHFFFDNIWDNPSH